MSESERDQNQSVSQALRELSAKVRAMEETLGDWPEVVGESVARALRAAEKRAGAHQAELAGKWAERLGGEVQRQKDLTAQLNQAARNLHIVLTWQQEVSAPWRLGWSRDRWQVVGVSVVLALLVSWGGVAIYEAVGPPAKARAELEAELANYRGVWNAMTKAEQEENNRRRQGQAQETGQ